jgi:hypothetical protein
MARSGSVSQLGCEFDNFLFASIGEERNGMLLSVVSALARSDVDPWQEAAKLAQLPLKTATQRLALLIAALPDGPSAPRDSGRIAVRLLALLPGPVSSNVGTPDALLGSGVATRSSPIRFVVTWAILWALTLSAQSIIASVQPSSQPGSSPVSTPGAIIPHGLTPPSDK